MRTKLTLTSLILALLAGLCPNMIHAQAAPVLNLTSYARLTPDTSAGLGASATIFNSTIYLAMKGQGNNYLWISSGTNGTSFPSFTEYTNIVMSYAPAIAVFNSQLYVVYTTAAGGVYSITSTNGTNWSFPSPVYSSSSMPATGPPTLVVYNNGLYAYWEENQSSGLNQIGGAVATPGFSWTSTSFCTYSGTTIATSPTSYAAVGAAVFNSQLYVGMQLGNSTTSNTLMVCRQNAFTNYTSIHPEGGISANVFGGSLYFGYKSNSSSNYLELTGTSDGSTFNTPGHQYTGIRINGTTGYEIAPALLPFNFDLYVFYTANDNTHYLYQTHSF